MHRRPLSRTNWGIGSKMYDSSVHGEAVAFLRRRTAGEAPTRLADIYPDANFGPGETTLNDNSLSEFG